MPASHRVIHHDGEALYQLSKTALKELIFCPMLHFLLRRFRKEIPHNRWTLLGKKMHVAVHKKFWKKDGSMKQKSQKKFAGSTVGLLIAALRIKKRDETGAIVRNDKGKPILVAKPNPTLDGRPVSLRDPETDFWWGFNKIRRCALTFATLFWVKPMPVLEQPFRFILNGVWIEGALDMMLPWNPVSGRWGIGEIKTSSYQPLQTNWEPTIYAMGWVSTVLEHPEIADYLGIPESIRAELRANPLAGFKYVEMIYYMLDEEDPFAQVVAHRREPRHWFEFVRTARERQRTALEAEGTGEIPLYRTNCDRCEARTKCDQYVAEQHGLATKPESLFDHGLVHVTGRKSRPKIGDEMVLNIQPPGRTPRKLARLPAGRE